jgi:transcriptional regulator with XRE-family HTH domain
MARAGLNIGIRELAEITGVSAMTISRFERGRSRGQSESVIKLQRALEAAGVIFVAPRSVAPGVRVRT